MKRVWKAVLCFLPFLAFLIGVNVYADPANVLRSGYEKTVAAILAQGQNAANLRNMDDRSFMRLYASMRTEPIDTLVLGSSRSMQVSRDVTGDPNTFTAGMTGSDLRDCISVYRLMREEGFAPKRVLLCLEPWYLCETTLEQRAMTDGYIAFCNENGFRAFAAQNTWWEAVSAKVERFSQAVSVPYFQSSVEFLKKGLQKQRDSVATSEPYADTDMRRADGSYVYNAPLRTVAPEETYERAKDCITIKPAFAQLFTNANAELTAQLEAFIREMQQDGAEVALMLSPFHPDYYAHILKQTDNYVQILETETIFQTVAETCNVKLMGSYDPTACGMVATDFFDALHCGSDAISKMYPDDLFTTLRR